MGENAAILPVKQLALTKQRLAGVMSQKDRRRLVEASLTDTLESILETRRLNRILMVTDDHAARRIAAGFGVEVLPEGGPSDHSTAAVLGIAHLMRSSSPPQTVILLPADCPLINPRELDRLLTGNPTPFVTVVPDRHGTGTNALVLSPPDAIEPAFGEGSRERHELLSRRAGVPYAVDRADGLGLDLDTPADLIAFASAYERSEPARGRRVAKALGV